MTKDEMMDIYNQLPEDKKADFIVYLLLLLGSKSKDTQPPFSGDCRPTD